eukprot:COSAG02_NODE_482_length_21409_cov_126.131018_8_plen_93_part_00
MYTAWMVFSTPGGFSKRWVQPKLSRDTEGYIYAWGTRCKTDVSCNTGFMWSTSCGLGKTLMIRPVDSRELEDLRHHILGVVEDDLPTVQQIR